jgi:hypothetical protein
MRNYIGLAYQFFNLTREAINEMVKQGNYTMNISDPQPDEEQSWKTYEEQTRWNDFNIGVPILFNFYHGLELFMKGLLQELGNEEKMTSHKLTDLESRLKNKTLGIPESMLDILNLHLSNRSPFHEFFVTNNLGIDNFYELLKYPESKKGQEFFFWDIRGQEQQGLKKFEEIKKATIVLKEEVIKWNKNKNSMQSGSLT